MYLGHGISGLILPHMCRGQVLWVCVRVSGIVYVLSFQLGINLMPAAASACACVYTAVSGYAKYVVQTYFNLVKVPNE